MLFPLEQRAVPLVYISTVEIRGSPLVLRSTSYQVNHSWVWTCSAKMIVPNFGGLLIFNVVYVMFTLNTDS